MSEQIILSCGFRNMKISTWVGVYPEELETPQILELSLRLVYPEPGAVAVTASDDLAAAMDYAQAAHIARAVCQSGHHGLLEFLAGRIMAALRLAFPSCREIEILLEKPGALADARCSRVELVWRL